ncbi:MAG: hypothetical protein NTY22_01665 [Proteobacteria bacterium]|nr:hypothetical protein [Pseudomonadota bacterium]
MLKFCIFSLTTFFICSVSYSQLNSPNFDVSAPARQNTDTTSTDTAKKGETKPTGNVVVETYVDTDGTTKYKSYRYGYQYKGKTVTKDKPEGGIQKKTVINPSGQDSEEDYVWGFQYAKDNKTATESTPSKLKTQKFQTIKRAPVSTNAPAPAGTTATDGTKVGTDEAAGAAKPEEIQKKLLDMIKQSQQQPQQPQQQLPPQQPLPQKQPVK